MLESAALYFWEMLRDTAPALGVGLVAAAVIQFLTGRVASVERVVRAAGRSVWLAFSAGAVLPGCALSTVPLAHVLRRNGAGIGTTAAFLVSSALLGPTSIILTLTLLGWDWTLARLLLPALAIILFGTLMNGSGIGEKTSRPVAPITPGEFDKLSACIRDCGCESPAESDPADEEHAAHASADGDEDDHHDHHAHGHHGHSHHHPGDSFWQTLRSLGWRLVPVYGGSLAVVAMVRPWLERWPLEDLLQGGALTYLLAALAGIPAYVCEGTEVPLTVALLGLGVGIGPAFTFLQASVGTCLPTILMATRIIGMQATLLYVAFWFPFAIGSGWVVAQWL